MQYFKLLLMLTGTIADEYMPHLCEVMNHMNLLLWNNRVSLSPHMRVALLIVVRWNVLKPTSLDLPPICLSFAGPSSPDCLTVHCHLLTVQLGSYNGIAFPVLSRIHSP